MRWCRPAARRTGEGRGRGQAVSLLPRNKEKSLLFRSVPLCINVILQGPTLLHMAIQLVFNHKYDHLGLVLRNYDPNLPFRFPPYLFFASTLSAMLHSCGVTFDINFTWLIACGFSEPWCQYKCNTLSNNSI